MPVMTARARDVFLWLGGTAGSIPASYFVWWFWGASACGEEAYDSPPGSTADAFCQALVRPAWPWAVLAATPALLALVGGFVGLVLRHRGLFAFSLIAPVAVGVLTLFLAPALF
jgi:hypothetical protein